MYSGGREPTVFIHVDVYVVIYIDYFVQNVYQACAYVEISFTTNMIQYNFDVNVLSSNYSCLLYYSFLGKEKRQCGSHSGVVSKQHPALFPKYASKYAPIKRQKHK